MVLRSSRVNGNNPNCLTPQMCDSDCDVDEGDLEKETLRQTPSNTQRFDYFNMGMSRDTEAVPFSIDSPGIQPVQPHLSHEDPVATQQHWPLPIAVDQFNIKSPIIIAPGCSPD